MYESPNINFAKIKNKILKNLKNKIFLNIFYFILIAVVTIILSFAMLVRYFPKEAEILSGSLKFSKIERESNNKTAQNLPEEPESYESKISYEQAIIDVVKNSSQSVVSIVISKNLPVYEQEWVNPFGDDSFFDIQIPQYVQKGTEYQEIGSGSGFVVSSDGLILTNKHVVSDKDADYTVITNDKEKYSAKVLATDPVQDLAIIKIEDAGGKIFNPLKLGDSSGIQIGQTAIAIGNALGEFSNTVSVGVVSGLGRTILASDRTGSMSETLEDIIQTDAAINSGNSGGPLLNLKGEVIGINTAIAEQAENIAFAIPINYAKRDIEQTIATNKIIYPFLGIRYILVTEEVKKEYDLDVNYGALISKGPDGQAAVTKGSSAESAGLKENDIILEINGQKINQSNTLSKIIQKYNAGDTVNLKVLRNSQDFNVDAILGERAD
jgi:serine protease Do